LLLPVVFASQKVIHNVCDEMEELVVPLRKKLPFLFEIKDSLTRQGTILRASAERNCKKKKKGTSISC